MANSASLAQRGLTKKKKRRAKILALNAWFCLEFFLRIIHFSFRFSGYFSYQGHASGLIMNDYSFKRFLAQPFKFCQGFFATFPQGIDFCGK
jgi:hypothetical protein